MTAFCQLSTLANEGNSGSPVINSNGEVVGIISSKENNQEGVVYAIKSVNVFNAIEELKKLGYEFDTLVNRDCTVPFIRNSDIINSVNLMKKTNCDLVCGVYKQHHNPYYNMMEPNSNGYLRFSKKTSKQIKSRQKAPIVYQLNGLFVINVARFLKYKKIYMPKCLPYEIPFETGLMIDTEFEFQIAEMISQGKIKI